MPDDNRSLSHLHFLHPRPAITLLLLSTFPCASSIHHSNMSFIRSIVPAARRAVCSRPLTSTSCRLVDPFKLPLSDPALAAGSQTDSPAGEEEWPLPQPLDRTGEDAQALRARLVYQTRKRGTLETDLLLSTFGRDFLPTMSVEEMKQFDKVRLGRSTKCMRRQ